MAAVQPAAPEPIMTTLAWTVLDMHFSSLCRQPPSYPPPHVGEGRKGLPLTHRADYLCMCFARAMQETQTAERENDRNQPLAAISLPDRMAYPSTRPLIFPT